MTLGSTNLPQVGNSHLERMSQMTECSVEGDLCQSVCVVPVGSVRLVFVLWTQRESRLLRTPSHGDFVTPITLLNLNYH